jgi:hypothetical protein
MKKVRYKGNLIRYAISYKGVDHIFSEVNNYTLDFEDDFALSLVKDNSLFEIIEEKNGDKNGMQQQKKQTETKTKAEVETETEDEKVDVKKKVKE